MADYVTRQPQDVLYMSITDLAEKCGVGDTTVFRFCKTLKLNGYQDFKMLLAQSLNSSDGSPNLTLSDEIGRGDSTGEVCRKLLIKNIASLNQTFGMVNPAEIQRAVEMMEKARFIHFFGMGSSCVMALEAKNKFAGILPNVGFVEDLHMQEMAAALLSEDDVAVAFSYSGSSKDTISILKHAKQCRARTLCITHFAESPLTTYADIVLLCGDNEGPFQGGSLSARIAQLYLLDVLYTEYFKRNFSVCDGNKRRTTQAIASRLL